MANTEKLRTEHEEGRARVNVSLWFPWNFLSQQLAESDTYDGD